MEDLREIVYKMFRGLVLNEKEREIVERIVRLMDSSGDFEVIL